MPTASPQPRRARGAETPIRAGDLRALAGDLYALTKPGITALVLVTAGVGFYLASPGALDLPLLLHTLVGTALLAGGTNALNQYAERGADGRMRRTQGRPLPSGRLRPRLALSFATVISVAGAAYLAVAVNALTATLGAAALCIYIFVYTPLKRRTSLCTIVGAIPGAIPPLMGWTAVAGQLEPSAWVLFGIVFLWQLPHFLAIAWMYRADYARAGFPMLPVFDTEGGRTGQQVVLYTLALLPVSLLTSVLGLTGALYFFGALTLGVGFLSLGAGFALQRSGRRAKKLFLASVVYLPVLLTLMVVDKV